MLYGLGASEGQGGHHASLKDQQTKQQQPMRKPKVNFMRYISSPKQVGFDAFSWPYDTCSLALALQKVKGGHHAPLKDQRTKQRQPLRKLKEHFMRYISCPKQVGSDAL